MPDCSIVVGKFHLRVVVIPVGFCPGIDRQTRRARHVLVHFDGADGRLNLDVIALIVDAQIADEEAGERQAEEHHYHYAASDNPENPPHRVVAAPLAAAEE